MLGPKAILGNLELLEQEPVLVMNSRQSKTPVGNDPWVRNTVEACRWAVKQNRPVIVSLGMNTWELGLWAAGSAGGNLVILCPEPGDSMEREKTITEVSRNFGLAEPLEHAWVFVDRGLARRGAKSWWEQRDQTAFGIAHCLLPVSVRPEGNWAGLLAEPDGRIVDESWRVPYSRKGLAEGGIEVPRCCFESYFWPFITHWTSRSCGPWPGELPADYYRDVVTSGSSYPRSAFDTLKRILEEETLRASAKRIRANSAVVAFTSLKPSEAVSLMRWRKRYVRPTFEPYGVALRIEAALKAGIQPVTYLRPGERSDTPPAFTQGYGKADWRAESEWRAIGDVDLRLFRTDDVVVLVPSKSQAERLCTRFRVLALDRVSSMPADAA